MSQTFNIPTWVEGNRVLFDVISQAGDSPEDSKTLQQHLYFNKQKFIDLLNSQPKNSSHRADLNANKAYINRIPRTVNESFVSKTLFLSDQLDINEHVAATLLMQSITQAKNIGQNPVDNAVIHFHQERGLLLESLNTVIKFAKDTEISEQVRSVCYNFMAEIMSETVPLTNNTTGTFTAKVLATLENLTHTINALYTSGTITGQTPAAGSGKLGDNISLTRMERLFDERVVITQILYHLASLFTLDTYDKLTMLTLLESAQLVDPATSHMIVTMLAAISNDNQSEQDIPRDASTDFARMFHRRIMTYESEVPVIKSTIVLQWIIYLTNPVRKDRITGGSAPITNEAEIQQLFEKAISTDVFRFMDQYLLHFQQPCGYESIETAPIEPTKSLTYKNTDYGQYKADICSDFQPCVVYELKLLSELIIRQQFGVLQSLKYKEEDFTAISNTGSTPETMEMNDVPVQCRDLEYFLSFLAKVFTGPAEGGRIFWERVDGLNHFVRWLLDIKVQTTVCAAFDFFAAISTGMVCATGTFNLFQRKLQHNLGPSSLFTWKKPLEGLGFYADLFQKNTGEVPCYIPADEELLLIKFLNILRQTVQYCKEARKILWKDNENNCRVALQTILKCPTTSYLRAAVFNVISAFCSSWGGGAEGIGRDISLQWWQDILNSNVLIVHRNPTSRNQDKTSCQPSSLLQDIEMEQQLQVYTETLAIVRLIGTAIHFPSKRCDLHNGFADINFYIPVGPHSNSKDAGVTPFISLVMDVVFTGFKVDKDSYTDMQWQVTEACLMVMENSINSFVDIAKKKNLKDGIRGTRLDIEMTLVGLLMHPGFQITVHILSGGRVANELFDIIRKCSKYDNDDTRKKCLIKSLRIILGVLELQHVLWDVIMPCVYKRSKGKTTPEFQLGNVSFPPMPSIVHIGQLIRVHDTVLVQIALLASDQNSDEIGVLSTRILQRLSADSQNINRNGDCDLDSMVFYNSVEEINAYTTNALSTCSSAEDIIFGISQQLKISVPEKITCDDYELDINLIPFWIAEKTLNNVNDYPDYIGTSALSSLRLAILDLLLANSRLDTNSFRLTEYLLGYNLSNTRSPELQDAGSNGYSLSCLHAILEMMQQGTEPITDGDSMMTDYSEVSPLLINTHPLLAEKCYELIYRLCAKESISLATLHYLRSREDFFYRQFKAMSSRFETDLFVESSLFSGTIYCTDGTEVHSDFFKVRAKLHQRAWLLQSIALELRMAALMEQKENMHKLLESLYGRPSEGYPFSYGLQQPLEKMLEFVSSLEFSWQDDLIKDGMITTTNYFQNFSQNQFLIQNQETASLYDIRAMFKFLRTTFIEKYANTEESEFADIEICKILEACMAVNRAREISFAKRQCMKAWIEVVRVTLLEDFYLIHIPHRERIAYDMLTMLLSKIHTIKDNDTEMLKNMSGLVLALLNSLKKENNIQPTPRLSAENLRYIFNGIVGCICEKNTEVVVRGDLYMSMVSLLQYISGHNQEHSFSELEKDMTQYITYKPEIIVTLCGDGIAGAGIWKTTASIAIDALNAMALRANSDVVQSYLYKQNYLQCVIDMIRCDDAALTNLLQSLDACKHSLHIFEAIITVLLRLSTNQTGAELLINHGVFRTFGHCQFIRANIPDEDSELSANYRILVIPVLKIIVGILRTYDNSDKRVLKMAQVWMRKQETAVNNILKTEGKQGIAEEAVNLIHIIQNYTK